MKASELWDGIKGWVMSDTVRENLDWWTPNNYELATIISRMRISLAEKRELLLKIDAAAGERLNDQIQELLRVWEQESERLAMPGGRASDRKDGAPMELLTTLDLEREHFFNAPHPAQKTQLSCFAAGDVVYNTLSEGAPDREYGVLIPARVGWETWWTTMEGRDGQLLSIEFLNRWGNFSRGGAFPWALESLERTRKMPEGMKQETWHYLKVAGALLRGRGSLADLLRERYFHCTAKGIEIPYTPDYTESPYPF